MRWIPVDGCILWRNYQLPRFHKGFLASCLHIENVCNVKKTSASAEAGHVGELSARHSRCMGSHVAF